MAVGTQNPPTTSSPEEQALQFPAASIASPPGQAPQFPLSRTPFPAGQAHSVAPMVLMVAGISPLSPSGSQL